MPLVEAVLPGCGGGGADRVGATVLGAEVNREPAFHSDSNVTGGALLVLYSCTDLEPSSNFDMALRSSFTVPTRTSPV